MSMPRITRREQGVVFGAILVGEGAERYFDCLSGPWKDRCAEAYNYLKGLGFSERRQLVAEMGRGLLSPVPEGIESVHPSWIAALLEQQTAPVAAAVYQLLPPKLAAELTQFDGPCGLSAGVRMRLAGHVLVQLRPMIEPSDGGVGWSMVAWPAQRLLRLLYHFGALVLGQSLVRLDETERDTFLASAEPGESLELVRTAMRLRPPAAGALLRGGFTADPVTGGMRRALMSLGGYTTCCGVELVGCHQPGTTVAQRSRVADLAGTDLWS